MDFYDYFTTNGFVIHKGLVPVRDDFTQTLKDMPDRVKRVLLAFYTNARISKTVKRDYKLEYALFGSTSAVRRKTKLRNKNRAMYEWMGLVKKGDKTEIHHKDGNVRNNTRNNLQVVDACTHNKLHGKACKKRKAKK
jgi:hypothetical protein